MNPDSVPPVVVPTRRFDGSGRRAARFLRRRVILLACLGLALSLISPLDASPRTGAAAASVAAITPAAVTAITPAAVTAITAAAVVPGTPSPAHPYSDPVWSPVRSPVFVSCVYSNCKTSTGANYHGLWAIDLIDTDPTTYEYLYAAGAGIFHIGARTSDACKATTTEGTWVWIDHGGGRTTRYTHLYRVNATEGQLVTPATRIGTMGHTGNKCGTTKPPNYLHMEYRSNGNTGPRLAPRVMNTCAPSGRLPMPFQGLGRAYTAWNSVPIRTDRASYLRGPLTPPWASNCLPATWTSTPARPIASGRRGAASATIGWGVVPAGVNYTVVTIQQWHPSLGRYGNAIYRTVTGTASSTRFTGLLNGRRYRFRATTHNGAGNSAWSSFVYVTPAAP